MRVQDHFARLVKQAQRKGFAGPRYPGWRGKLRFAAESLIARRELVFVLDPSDFEKVPIPDEPSFNLVPIASIDDLAEYREDLEQLWYPGLIEGWRGPFEWRERLFLGLQHGRPVSFNWLQAGEERGGAVHWGRILEGEYRILRGGVAPALRGRGINTLMKHTIIRNVFDQGATRFYAECYEANVPSVRTLTSLGFRAIARLEVLELPGLRGFVRWKSPP